MAEDDTQGGTGVGFGKLLAAVIATLNVVGGATIGRSWLYDLGLRYYDALGERFGLPAGTFALSDARLLSTGWDLTRRSSMFTLAIALLIVPMAGSIAAMLAFKAKELRRERGEVVPSEPMSDLAKFRLYAGISAIFFMFGLVMTINATIVLPHTAFQAGSAKADDIVASLTKPGCANCRIYGAAKVTGLPITSDTRAIYVVDPKGAISAVPLANLIVARQTLPKPAARPERLHLGNPPEPSNNQ